MRRVSMSENPGHRCVRDDDSGAVTPEEQTFLSYLAERVVAVAGDAAEAMALQRREKSGDEGEAD